MKKIILILLLLVCHYTWAQGSKLFHSYQYSTSYLDKKTWTWKPGMSYTENVTLEFYSNVIQIKHSEIIHNERHNILYETNEEGNRVIYSTFMCVKYKFVFPFNNPSVLNVYTIESNGNSFEMITYYLD